MNTNLSHQLSIRLNRANRLALWLNIGLALGAVRLVNGGIATLNWTKSDGSVQQASA